MQEKIRVVNEEITAESLQVIFYIELLKTSFPAVLLLEQPGSSTADYAVLLAKSRQTLESLFYKSEISRIIEEVAVEITESAYEGELRMQEYADLKQDLVVSEFHFYEEEFLITLNSPKIFLQNNITAQVNYLLAIEDISIDL